MFEETKTIYGPFTVDQVRELIPEHYNVKGDFISFYGDCFSYAIKISAIDNMVVSKSSINVNVGESTFFFYLNHAFVSLIAL